MTRISNIFNLDNNIRTRSFEYGGKTFKVRIPLVAENDAMKVRIAECVNDKETIDAIYEMRTAGLGGEGVEVLEDDIIVEGRSMREACIAEHKAHVQITEMFNLLVFEHDDGKGPLTYADIEAELPFTVQIELMRKIAETITPSLENTKKN